MGMEGERRVSGPGRMGDSCRNRVAVMCVDVILRALGTRDKKLVELGRACDPACCPLASWGCPSFASLGYVETAWSPCASVSQGLGSQAYTTMLS